MVCNILFTNPASQSLHGVTAHQIQIWSQNGRFCVSLIKRYKTYVKRVYRFQSVYLIAHSHNSCMKLHHIKCKISLKKYKKAKKRILTIMTTF